MTDADRFAWVDDERLTAACFTIVEGDDHDRIVQVFGGDLSTERTSTFEQAFNDYPRTQHLVFDRIDDFVLVAENNGWEGSRPEVAEPASAAGRYAGVYWSVNADMTFVYASEGILIAWFDPLLIEHEWAGSDPGSLAELTRDLPFGVESPRAASFALMERLTGVRIERRWLDAPHRCVDLVPRD